ncbi:hypothetical protein C731_1473 [Mycolicibacterium hassiacum DSM 44199]|uniref:Uncharacterized protein n=1 Tax=Mycolicibacterium hassiacum (strain DSM 44199 / CIP 105218 / JCM 12690 / 3849) TaxID=1122247 RepID=K5B8Z1_MYCHD|nr:hypothetical protein C731_1473 [Mycolicibacterium hassiacum DSM 44199]
MAQGVPGAFFAIKPNSHHFSYSTSTVSTVAVALIDWPTHKPMPVGFLGRPRCRPVPATG